MLDTYTSTFRYTFSSNHNIYKSLCGLFSELQTLWLIDITQIYWLKGLKPKNKGHTNFYEHCVLMKKYFQPTHITYLEDAKFFDRFLLLETFPIHPFCMNSYPVQICLRWVSNMKWRNVLLGLRTKKNNLHNCLLS